MEEAQLGGFESGRWPDEGERKTTDELPALDERMRLMLRLGFPGTLEHPDFEQALAKAIITLIHIERLFTGRVSTTGRERASRSPTPSRGCCT